MNAATLGAVMVICDDHHSREICRAIEAEFNCTPGSDVMVICADNQYFPSAGLETFLIQERQSREPMDRLLLYSIGHKQPHYRLNYKTGKPIRF